MNPESQQIRINDCSISSIKNLFEESKIISNHFNEKWKDLSLILKIDNETVRQIETKFKKEKLTTSELLITILNEWRNRDRNEATLESLIKCLRKIESHEFADLLSANQAAVTKQHAKRSRDISEIKSLSEPAFVPFNFTSTLEIVNKKRPEQRAKMFSVHSSTSIPISTPLLSSKRSHTKQTEKADGTQATSWSYHKVCLLLLVLLSCMIALISILMSLVVIINDGKNNLSGMPKYYLVQQESSFEQQALPSANTLQSNASSGTLSTTGSLSEPSNQKQECFEIRADTLVEFNEKMLTLGKQKSACVSFYLSGSSNWKSSELIINHFPQIISASFILSHSLGLSPTDVNYDNTDAIIEILGALTSLQQLRIKQSCMECVDVRIRGSKFISTENARKYHMGYLTEIVFENVGKSSHLFELISSNLFMPRLKILEIRNGTIGSDNLTALQGLLKNVRFSIQKLYLPEIICEEPLAQNFMHILGNVIELQHWTSNVSLRSQNCINNEFHVNLPAIRRLILQNTTLCWSKYNSILKLRHLDTLDVAVEIPNLETFSCKMLVESLPMLKYVSIRLKFLSLSNCTISGIEMFRKIMQRKLFTNCALSYQTKIYFGK